MSKVMKLVAIYAYTNKSNGVATYVLDGSPEQHEEYLSRVDAKYQPEDGYTSNDGKLPELIGNPVYKTSFCKRRIVELTIPADPKRQPYIESEELDLAKAEAEECNEPIRPVLEKHYKMLDKHRFSAKANTDAENVEQEEDLDGLD